jgi:hypothetical protein
MMQTTLFDHIDQRDLDEPIRCGDCDARLFRSRNGITFRLRKQCRCGSITVVEPNRYGFAVWAS